MQPYPRMIRIRQRLDGQTLDDVHASVRREMNSTGWASKVKSGDKVAITAGSRGIAQIVPITAAVASMVKEHGAQPFVVPAMGSHGGATAEGQIEILRDYGMTEGRIGAPVLSSMDVVGLGATVKGIPVFLDKLANEADHIIVINRIKPHTEFHGKIESGLIKMLVIGLGKHRGAIEAHRYAVRYGYEQTLIEVGQYILQHAHVLLGIGIIENGFSQTASIHAIEPERFLEREIELLKEARRKKASLPFDQLDILVVDEAGKEISGTGLETHVIGRIMNIYEPELHHPRITRIILRDLTEKTHGNAIGIGLADFVTERVINKMDVHVTRMNCITAVTPEKARIPIVCKNDREAFDFALATAGPVDAENVRVARIRNTVSLSEMLVSEGLVTEVETKGLKKLGELKPLRFDPEGNWIDP